MEGELLYRCPLHALDEIKSAMETYKNILVNFHDVLDANEIAGRIDELEQGFKKIKELESDREGNIKIFGREKNRTQ